jgi:lipoate-protein ligase B
MTASLVSTDRVAVRGHGIRRRILATGLAVNLVPAVVFSTIVAAGMAGAPTTTADAAVKTRVTVNRPGTALAASLAPRGPRRRGQGS